jgi:predicted lipid-binding transport protein (Tim44 family)
MGLPNSKAPQGGFGKRGNVTLNRPTASPSPAPAAPEPEGSGFSVPKWAIGGIAAVMLFALMLGSGVGSGGFLGGLLGGMLANKLMNSNKPATVAAKPAQAPYDFKSSASAQAPTSQSGPTTVARGGFGTTVSSSSSPSFVGG